MRLPPMRFAPYSFCLGVTAALAAFACSSTPTTTTAVVRPQLVAVDPADFMGNVPCEAPRESLLDPDGGTAVARNPNAAHSYVATLFDVTPDEDGGVPNPGTPLASSSPTTCQQQATFSFVVSYHRYLAEIEAYREDPSELIPISPGSRLMTDLNGTRVVSPWATSVCGGYPPSPYVEAGTEAAGAGGTDGTDGTEQSDRPPGVVSYSAITQTPHNCQPPLHDPNAD